MNKIAESELVLNPDGSVYHLKLKPEHIAGNIIIVGDPGRVETVSKHFEMVEFRIQNREFTTHTGTFNGKQITVLSTGIGTDNIDIVMNELDAAVNIDLEKRQVKEEHKSLNIVRIGTSGALQKDIPVDSFVISNYGLGLDGLLHYYRNQPDEDEEALQKAFVEHTHWDDRLAAPYFANGSEALLNLLSEGMIRGITATATGFYGPQGRTLRLGLANENLNEQLASFNHKGERVTNFEMETSALYGLGKLLGHNCCTCCAIVANRATRQYSENYKATIERLVRIVLERLCP